jgi:hypothetical protein
VLAGVGVTARMPVGLPPGVGAWERAGLPALPPVRLSLHRRLETGAPAVDALFGIVAATLQAGARDNAMAEPGDRHADHQGIPRPRR